MTFAAVLELINGFFKFSNEIASLIRTLNGTPEEHRAKIMESIKLQAEQFSKTGRPQ